METCKFFPEVKGRLGFGCMRLPMIDGKVDTEQFCRMTDAFIDAGFNYFDTAHGYISGQSETAIAECVSARHDRSEFLLTDKLSDGYFKSEEGIRPFFMSQLKACGVDYFDFYLMHAQDKNNYPKYKRCRAYETAFELKKEGYIRHVGISFHDKAEVLDRILTDYPEIEAVQIQFNYLDYDDASVESRKVYDVCIKHGKPVIVMEPVKGGSLVNLPDEADALLRELGEYSNAGYALRFAASFDSMFMVLSGMSDLSQMEDNIKTMADFKPLSENEKHALGRVCGIFKGLGLVQCTACRYCVEQNECPVNIRIPDMFSTLNAYEAFHDWNSSFYYNTAVIGDGHAKASECLKCGMCESVCPQHLPIRDLLEKVADTFEKKEK